MQNTSSLASNQRIISPQTRFYAVVGPTASGKTEFALVLAEKLRCEILCVDAMQVYRGLDIGSAKPLPEERNRIFHHGLDLVSPLETFSASRFALYAEFYLEKALRENTPLVLCGGTGLYYRALLEGLFEVPDPDPVLRDHLNNRARQEGTGQLYKELLSADPEIAQTIHVNDARRITRALEIIAQTGSTVTELRRTQKRKSWMDSTCFLGMERNREELDERIVHRTLQMYESGLMEETRTLLRLGCTNRNTALQALGYKECYEYLRGRTSLQEAVAITTKETQRYARRQLTWFRRQVPTNWVKINTFKDLRQKVDESLQL